VPAGIASPATAASPHCAGCPASSGGDANVPWGFPLRARSRVGVCVSTQSPPAATRTTCAAFTVSSIAAEPSMICHSSPSSPVPITSPGRPHASAPAICLVKRCTVVAAPCGRMRTISDVDGPLAVCGVALALSLTETVTEASPSSLAGGFPSVGSPVSAAA